MLAAGFAVLLLAKPWCNSLGATALGSAAGAAAGGARCGQDAPMTLRSRIALPESTVAWTTTAGTANAASCWSRPGQHTVEIIDSWRQVHTIAGLEHPQASSLHSGRRPDCGVEPVRQIALLRRASYALIKTLDFGAEANPTTCATILPASESTWPMASARAARSPWWIRRPWNVFKIQAGSHPESFSAGQNGSRIFVNLPDQEASGSSTARPAR